MKMFDFAIGNPPYMESTNSDSNRMPPVYNYFMDAAYEIADKVELITPARFLFNAGYTPKGWSEKMLQDKHFKILEYEPNASIIFSETEIKGGVAISYRDKYQEFGAIEIFTRNPELNSILKKVRNTTKDNDYLDSIIFSPLNFKVSDVMKREHPDLVDRLRSSAFVTLSKLFFEEEPNDGYKYIKMVGLYNNKRTSRYIRADYIQESGNTLNNYTLLVSKANGMGYFGETLSPAIIAGPGVGYIQTFIGIGSFETEGEVKNTEKYIKTKFARTMLGVLKITQDCPGPKWKYVPLQDFTSASDVDWSKSIPEIDQQLYKKYGLSKEEIEFIETHVKEMV